MILLIEEEWVNRMLNRVKVPGILLITVLMAYNIKMNNSRKSQRK